MAVPLYPTVRDAVFAKLTADSGLQTVLPGKVWRRELKRSGPGMTPEAFSQVPPKHVIRPSIVVPDSGENADGIGPRGSFLAFPSIVMYAPASDSGHLVIEQIMLLARMSLVGWVFGLSTGTGCVIEMVAGRMGVHDDPIIEGAISDTMRFQVGGMWRVEF
jgi:hypothetical protein